jgi:ABC-type Fe3+-hydroxamate transport system substrate-binding protein
MKRLALIALAACLTLAAAADTAPRRVISLIPATTEMIFAMGAGNRLIAVSSYDKYPPEALKLPRVGALLDPDTERILSLHPDLVIVYGTQTELKRSLDRATIPYYSYEHRAMPDIMSTIRAVGARIGYTAQANSLASSMEQELAAVRAAVAGRPRPRTLLVFERDRTTLQNMYASGGYGFLADLLDAAGGDNIFADVKQQSVQAGTEQILARRPDVIVELRYGESATNVDPSKDLRAWDTLGSVPAVRTKRIVILVGDQYVVPGPRIVQAARELARALHPGIKW